eukprot:5524683-Lingulodinium_polyedra.AAC.1
MPHRITLRPRMPYPFSSSPSPVSRLYPLSLWISTVPLHVIAGYTSFCGLFCNLRVTALSLLTS